MLTRRNVIFGGTTTAAVLFMPTIVRAQPNKPLLSANWRSDRTTSDPPNGLMTFSGQTRLNGVPPQGCGFPMQGHCLIVSVEVSHVIMNGGSASETCFIGHWSQGNPTTDMISPEVVGSTSAIRRYEIGQQPEWNDGDFFDC